MRVLLLAVLCLVALECINAYRGPFNRFLPKTKPTPLTLEDDPGEPLFLTPYLERGDTAKARELRYENGMLSFIQ